MKSYEAVYTERPSGRRKPTREHTKHIRARDSDEAWHDACAWAKGAFGWDEERWQDLRLIAETDPRGFC